MLGAALLAPAAMAAPIGTTAISTNQVSAKLGAAERALRRGDAINQNEIIRTGAASAAQLLFRDETSMSLGANTEIILDKMAYDPARKQGEVVVRAVNGAFRFVSGSMDSSSYKVTTPVGTIGVRGTMFSCDLNPRALFCRVTQGAIDVCDLQGGCVNVPTGSTVLTNGYITRTARDCSGPNCSQATQAERNSLLDTFLSRRPNPTFRVIVR
jgi:hypothetical protein